jgi:hypothetical protein
MTVFGPGWVFLKPYRERLSKIDIRVQQCEIQIPLSPPVKILYSFKIIDIQKSATAALQHAEHVLEQSNISDRQKGVIRYSREFNSLTKNITSLTKSIVALSYVKFARELKAELDGLFIDKGLQLINISFLLDNGSGK